MILGEGQATAAPPNGGATLDAVFRATVARRPNAIALVDPPNRETCTDGQPRRLSYAEADRIVSAIAARLRGLGLPIDSVVGVQLPNTVEGALTVLGILRAGMIAALLPLLWRRADMVTALGRVGAKAIVTASRIGGLDHGELATKVAAELFPVRHVCSFGSSLRDGVIAFDDLLTTEPERLDFALNREHGAADHVAVLTFDVTSRGIVAVARNHRELLAAGQTVLEESRMQQDATILGCCTIGSFGGLAVTVLPWLSSGGTLSLHQPFDPTVFATQCQQSPGLTVVLPGTLLPRLAAAGFAGGPDIKTVLAAWRAPERLLTASPWHSDASLIDVAIFGETGLCALPRRADGRPQSLQAGIGQVPCATDGRAGHDATVQLARTETGTLALRGTMVPQHPFPAGAESIAAADFRADAQGFVDTGYACRIDKDTGTLTVTAPPPGLITVGGCRLLLRDLEDEARRADPDAALAALPDALMGHRLVGHAADSENIRAALTADGANALLVAAFRDRRAPVAG